MIILSDKELIIAIIVIYCRLSYTCWYIGQIMPVPENVSACVIYQGNKISLNVQWNVQWNVSVYNHVASYSMP